MEESAYFRGSECILYEIVRLRALNPSARQPRQFGQYRQDQQILDFKQNIFWTPEACTLILWRSCWWLLQSTQNPLRVRFWSYRPSELRKHQNIAMSVFRLKNSQFVNYFCPKIQNLHLILYFNWKFVYLSTYS